jgi:hypothetical protein
LKQVEFQKDESSTGLWSFDLDRYDPGAAWFERRNEGPTVDGHSGLLPPGKGISAGIWRRSEEG